jgi:hypothetical protein
LPTSGTALGRLLFPPFYCHRSAERCIAQRRQWWHSRGISALWFSPAWLLSVSQGTFSQANAQAQSPSPGPSDRTTAIPEQKLDAAAAVLERIASLKKDYEEQMVAAPASDKKRIAAEAFSAFQKAVTDQGLSVNEYISILEVAQNDPEVGDKIRQRLPTSPN